MEHNIHYRSAQQSDLDSILKLLPHLSDFELPLRRVARHLWEGDAALLTSVLEQSSTVTFADVAVDSAGLIQGVIMVTLREELLSHAPSAHLETIVVAPAARCRGIGRSLLARAEDRARELGAQSLTLHVFNNNRRARRLYQRGGYEEELLRCIKWLD